ncbi:MAG: oxygen-insensitive NAD(P)H nitroreductase [Alphaproteobacteria bacterium]
MTKLMDINAADITHFALNRHTVKAFDPARTIDDATVEKLKTLLRFSPSSTNAQPWHFIMASTPEGKARMIKGTEGKYPFNSPSITKASHVVLFASRLEMTESHLQGVLDQEDKDGRFNAESAEQKAERKAGMDGGRRLFMNLHKQHYKDVQHWMDKQVYLNIGQFLLGAAALGVDATPMEGIDIDAMDAEFGLRDKGFTSLVVVCLGYHDPKEDYNAALPKSRLPFSEILTEI